MKTKNILSKYFGRLKNNIFFQNIAVVAGGNATARLIGIVAAPVITRLYTPEEYGLFSVFISIIGVTGSLATLRYAVTIPIVKEEKLVSNVIKLCFLITFSLSLLWFLVIELLGGFIAVKLSAEQIQSYLWLIPVAFFSKGVYEALNNLAIRHQKFRLITRTKVSQGISSTGVKIGLGAAGVTPLGLFVGQITQEAAGIISLFFRLKKLSPVFNEKFSWPGIIYVAKRYKKFPLVQSWSQLLLALGAQLPVLMLGAFYGIEVVGVFGLAQNMINMPIDLIGQSVAQVYYAEISKYGKYNPDKIYRLSISIIKKLFLIGLIPVGILIFYGPFLFKLVFGAEWIEAGFYARILSILILFRFVSSPIMNCLNVLERQGIQLWLNGLRLILVVVTIYLSYRAGVTPLKAMMVYSVTIAAFYLYVIIKIFRLLKLRIKEVSL